MSLVIKESASYTPAPAGLHNAVCISIIDLGLQQTTYGAKHQILFGWELSNTPMDNGNPFTLSRRFTPSLSPKSALRAILESWIGRALSQKELSGLALKQFLGKPCQLLVRHSPSLDGSRTYANVAAVIPANGGVVVTPQAELLFFDKDAPDSEVLARMPQWVRKLVDSAIQPQPAIATPYAAESDRSFNDELSF